MNSFYSSSDFPFLLLILILLLLLSRLLLLAVLSSTALVVNVDIFIISLLQPGERRPGSRCPAMQSSRMLAHFILSPEENMAGEWKGMAWKGIGIGSLILARFLLCCTLVNKSEYFERFFRSFFSCVGINQLVTTT